MLADPAASRAGLFEVPPLSADRRSSVDRSFHTGSSYRRSLPSLHSIPMAPPTRRAGPGCQRIPAGDESMCAIGPTATVMITTERTPTAAGLYSPPAAGCDLVEYQRRRLLRA